MKRNPFIILGITIIVTVLLFDIVWFSYSIKDEQHTVYEVSVNPAAGGLYTLMVPTLVDAYGQETDAANKVTTSKLVMVGHVNTPHGKALYMNTSGALKLRIDVNEWSGQPSMSSESSRIQRVRVYSSASENFAIQVEIRYSSESSSEKSNVFGEEDGMFGGSIVGFNVSGSISSMSNWTVLEGLNSVLCYDGLGDAAKYGLLFSIPGYVAGIAHVALGLRKKNTIPDD